VIGIYLMIPKEKPLEYYLVLNGLEDVVIYQDMEYIDSGYMAYDNKGNELNQDVVIEGEVNTGIVGEYKIKYILNDIEKERTVTVLAKSMQLTFLVLLGDRTMYLKSGEVYQEPGYNVIDSYDDDLEKRVVVNGGVNVNEPGTYKIKYTVINRLGVEFVEERTVIVLGTDVSVSYTPIEMTNEKVLVNIGVVDNYFDYVLLPNNQKSYERYVKYEVTSNGIYKFLIYSKNGTYQEKIVNINNIDKEGPNGNCSGYYKSGKSYITVNANDNMSGISKYVVNNQSFMKNSVVANGEFSTVVVTIYDKAGNFNSISCQLTNKNEVVVRPSSTSSSKYSSSSSSSKYSSSSIRPSSSIIYPSSSSSSKYSSSSSSSNTNGIVMCNDDKIYYGTKYSLTTSQKQKLAAMVYSEGGYNYVGMKAVASHMANLYEERKFNDPSINESFYEYIHDNKWYSAGTRSEKYDGSSQYMRQALEAVEEVIVGGRRTLPLYIDEFDWFPNDVVNAMDKSKYVQGQTIYNNKYSRTEIVFWCFNLNSKGTSGNIFGYIKKYSNYREYLANR